MFRRRSGPNTPAWANCRLSECCMRKNTNTIEYPKQPKWNTHLFFCLNSQELGVGLFVVLRAIQGGRAVAIAASGIQISPPAHALVYADGELGLSGLTASVISYKRILQFAANWPVLASFIHLAVFAKCSSKLTTQWSRVRTNPANCPGFHSGPRAEDSVLHPQNSRVGGCRWTKQADRDPGQSSIAEQ